MSALATRPRTRPFRAAADLEAAGLTQAQLDAYNAQNPGQWNLARVPRRGWRFFRVPKPTPAHPAPPTFQVVWVGMGVVADTLKGIGEFAIPKPKYVFDFKSAHAGEASYVVTLDRKPIGRLHHRFQPHRPEARASYHRGVEAFDREEFPKNAAVWMVHGEITPEIVAAFNALLADKHNAFLAEIDANPNRFLPMPPGHPDRNPPPAAVGIRYSPADNRWHRLL